MCVIFVGTLHMCNICGDTTCVLYLWGHYMCVIFVGTPHVCNICGDTTCV
jgi:hypothetical protein